MSLYQRLQLCSKTTWMVPACSLSSLVVSCLHSDHSSPAVYGPSPAGLSWSSPGCGFKSVKTHFLWEATLSTRIQCLHTFPSVSTRFQSYLCQQPFHSFPSVILYICYQVKFCHHSLHFTLESLYLIVWGLLLQLYWVSFLFL